MKVNPKQPSNEITEDAIRGCPPLTLRSIDAARYYKLHGAIEEFYFKVCDLEERRHDRKLWRQLNRDLAELEDGVFSMDKNASPNLALCFESLANNVTTCRKLLWLNDSSEEAQLQYVEEEGGAINTYNDNNWFSDPYYWEDQIGGALNDLVLCADNLVDPETYASLLEQIEFYNEQRIHNLSQWSLVLQASLPSLPTNEIVGHIEDSARQVSFFTSKLKSAKSVPGRMSLIYDFAVYRDEKCLLLAGLFQRVKEV